MMDLLGIDSLSIAKYSRAFARPLNISGKILHTREGIYLRAQKDAAFYWGEAAPLGGITRETLRDVEDYLLSNTKEHLLGDWQEKKSSMPGTVRFALDSIFLGAGAQKNYDKKLRLNAVLSADNSASMQEKISICWNLGFRDFKFKVTPHTADACLKSLEFLRAFAEEKYHVRLDSNHTFSPKEILNFAPRLAGFVIEFWEDPLDISDKYSWLYFKKECPIPIALDQKIFSLADIQRCLAERLANIYVIKPSCIGGLEYTQEAIHLIRQARAHFVITSAFESEVGIAAIANYCLQFPAQTFAYGLASQTIFDKTYLPCQSFWGAKAAIDANFLSELSALPWRSL